jgi:carotenoid cleavage dioxygenase-like enzyme
MNRRWFLTQALLGSGALVASRLAPALSLPSPNERFAAGLARHPWLAGWQDAPLFDGLPTPLTVSGTVPAGLRGTLYRNGPGRFSRAGFRYRHWFDGDGLIHGWKIGDGGISHRARFVATRKFQREERAGRFLLPAAGTRVPDAVGIRNSDDLNVANTALVTHAGELYALWEGGSAHRLDAETLQSDGPVTWRDDLASVPFSAHPLHDADGSLWNFGLMGSQLVIWRIGADGQVRDIQSIETPFPGYMHAFSMSAEHLLFVLLPYVTTGSMDDQSYFESLRWQPERGCRALVLDKANLQRQRWYGLPAGAAYHYGPVLQQGRELVLQACWNRDGAAAISPFAAELAGQVQRIDSGSSLQQIRLHLDTGQSRMDSMFDGSIDFPSWSDNDNSGSFYALTGAEATESGYFDSVARFDPTRGVQDRHHYGEGCMVEEHRFVPAPQAQRARQGWLIGTVLDYRRGRSGISILDAENLAAGPLAQAWLPGTVPLGFHGWFA